MLGHSVPSRRRRLVATLFLVAGSLATVTSCAPDEPVSEPAASPARAGLPPLASVETGAFRSGQGAAGRSAAATVGPEEVRVEPLGRVVYGCVATHWCDPVSNVRVLLGDEEVARTSRWGDFCATGLPPGDVTLTFVRAGFAPADVTLPAGTDRLECQPLLGPDDGDTDETFRMTVVQQTLRGPAGADVLVRDAASGEELLRATTSVLGTFLVPAYLRNCAADVDVTWGDPPATVTTTGRLSPWFQPRFRYERGQARVRLDRNALRRPGEEMTTWYHNGNGARMATSTGAETTAWSLSCDSLGLTAWAVVSTTDRLVSRPVLLLLPEQDVRLEPSPSARLVLHPATALAPGQLRVVAPWGPDDVVSAVSVDDVPVLGARHYSIRHAGVTEATGGLATPTLDVGEGAVMLVHEDRRRDRRVLFDARLPRELEDDATIHREVDVATGTGRLVVRLEREGDSDTEIHGVLARRGGAYYVRKRVPRGGEAVFNGLCAGTFAFWFQERDSGAESVSGFFDIRGVRIAADAAVELNARWRSDPPRARMQRAEHR